MPAVKLINEGHPVQSDLDGQESAAQVEPKLAEVSKLLPHLLLCLDYQVAARTMKCF